MIARWLTLWLTLWVLSLNAVPAWSADDSAPEAADVRLVIDVSGSMKDNDSANLRASGVRLLVDLLPDGTRAGFWTFGQQVTNPLADAEVNDRWRQRALNVLPQLTRYEQYTDLESALERVTATLDRHVTTHLIVLTDGMVDVPAVTDSDARNRESRQRILDELAPELADRNVVVHTIALSENADIDLMRALSQQTGGLASVAPDASELLRSFLDVLNQVVPRQQLPLDNGRFEVDERVREFTALVFHAADEGPVTLIAPNGERLSRESPGAAQRWRHDERYDLITVPQPASGEWRVEGPVGEGSRVLIESDLQLRSEALPATLYQYFPLSLTVWLEGLRDESVSALIAELRDDRGIITTARLTAAGQGRYRAELTGISRLGNAELRLLARGNGFRRLLSHGVNVVPALDAQLAADQSHIILSAAREGLNSDNTQPRAALLGDPLTVGPVGEQRWRVVLPSRLPEQAVAVSLAATIDLDGTSRDIELPPVWLNSDAATSLAGLGDTTAPVDSQPMAAEAPDEAVDEHLSLDTLWPWVKTQWPQWREQAERWALSPVAWGVLGALLLLWMVLTLMSGRRRRRRAARRRRKEPRV
ncbi:VWA domain-containing protein [Kushneria aurantia]|uniref:VWA domain-containing protein n=1 Tax=Kushneria aurantia TaxID=504092 RepID=A0ABV6G7N8_9GAMM|nr:vWA domain-containing protein [Kushneria aurantia]